MSIPPFLACQLAAIVDYADKAIRNGECHTRDIDDLRRAFLEAARKVAALRPGAELNEERDAASDRYLTQAGQDCPLEEIFNDWGGAA
jgi:hypothetical protein